MFTKTQAAKFAAEVVVTSSVAHVVHDIVEENTDPESKAEEVQTLVGTYVLSAVIVHHAWKHAEMSIDKAVDAIAKFKASKNATE